MIRVLLLNGGQVPHYRVSVYNSLARYLKDRSIALTVASQGVEPGNATDIQFEHAPMKLSFANIVRTVWRGRFDVVIMWVNMRTPYLFPVYLVVKGMLRRKMVWWGQGRDLAHPNDRIKNLAYGTEHAMCDAIILYAEHLRKYVAHRFQHKVFVANNTLGITNTGLQRCEKDDVLRSFQITTRKNIICMGRFQKRKRIDNLLAAMRLMERSDIGLILVGPDKEGVLKNVEAPNIYKLGPIYGDQRFDLLSVADVYCLPGAVGLSIVDAFLCGLPFVTEEGDESAEIVYLKHAENGFVVPRGDASAMAKALLQLLNDDVLRAQFSAAARREIATNGSIEKMCEGFWMALQYATASAPH